jgi:hypothetical protein
MPDQTRIVRGVTDLHSTLAVPPVSQKGVVNAYQRYLLEVFAGGVIPSNTARVLFINKPTLLVLALFTPACCV